MDGRYAGPRATATLRRPATVTRPLLPGAHVEVSVRPMLKPALRRLWRDAATVQIGVDPERAVILSGVDGAAATVLDLLDGSRDHAGVLAAAAAAGVHPGSAAGLLEQLDAAGVLDDASTDAGPLAALDRAERDRMAPELASVSLLRPEPGAALAVLDRRRSAVVLVVGAGRIGVPVATLLAAAGVGHVAVEVAGTVSAADTVPGGWQLADIGMPVATAVRAAVRRIAPTAGCGPVPADSRPDVVVLVGAASGDPVRRLELVRGGVPHLAAGVREVTGVVGPLVLPGHSACLRCLDLTRADRDSAWPLLSAQLAGGGAGGVAAGETVLAAATAALAAGQVLAVLDGGRPTSVNGTLELRLPEWRLRRRGWSPHPACGCSWRQAG